MAKSVFDLISADYIGTFYTEAASNRTPMLGATLFPAVKQLGLDLSWIKGRNGLPVSLAPAAFDAKAPLRDRVGVEKVETEMPFFREAMRVGEKERQELLKAASGMNQAYVMPIINRIYADAQNLVDGADVVAERLRMQLLSTGEAHIVGKDGAAYDYDFGMPAEHKKTLTGSAKWSDPKADVYDTLRKAKKKIAQDTGATITRAICNTSVWDYLLANEQIKGDIVTRLGTSNALIVDEAVLRQWFSARLGLTVTVYDKMFKPTFDGAGENFFPDDTFTLIPDGTLGNTYHGTTPEEADLMSGASSAQVRVVNTGVAVTTYIEPHPVNSVIVVSDIVLPSFEAIDNIYILKV